MEQPKPGFSEQPIMSHSFNGKMSVWLLTLTIFYSKLLPDIVIMINSVAILALSVISNDEKQMEIMDGNYDVQITTHQC